MATCLNLYSGATTVPTGASNLEMECMGVDSSGNAVPFATWVATWSGTLPDDPLDRTCSQLYHDEIYSLGGDNIFDPTQFARIEQQYTYMLSKYFNTTIEGFNISLPGQIGFNPFQDTLIQSCVDVGGVCATAEAQLCNGCTRSDISNNSSLIGLCGCFAPVLSPTIYTRTIPTACDPLCNNSTAAQLINATTGAQSVCTDSVCVIDSLSVNAVKTTTGGVNIAQICTGCSTGCTCVIDTSILNLTSGIGLDNPALFQQYCPPSESTCLVINNTTQSSTVVPCANSIPGAATTPDSAIPLMAYVILIIVVGLVLVVLAAYLYVASSRKAYAPRLISAVPSQPVVTSPIILPTVYYPNSS